MVAKLALSSSLTTKVPVLSKPCAFSQYALTPSHSLNSQKPRVLHHLRINAKLGGGDGELKPKGKRKFVTREEEPEQFWQTAGEREGENPMKTPLPYIIIFGMSTPFVILAIAFANGWIKVPVR
ncbi:hypothetical protein ACOSP7_002915 [Xanthoceras sorbifolium]|uniref:Transmembrane protein n=1 Tax=Xanthoceras sorbifolium TaxID=99658 RepID=A0ABQ8IJE7_9ROSI|nr:hypothetical protein JRO89_XS01G0117300 [Xanthoceras sorbifolium]